MTKRWRRCWRLRGPSLFLHHVFKTSTCRKVRAFSMSHTIPCKCRLIASFRNRALQRSQEAAQESPSDVEMNGSDEEFNDAEAYKSDASAYGSKKGAGAGKKRQAPSSRSGGPSPQKRARQESPERNAHEDKPSNAEDQVQSMCDPCLNASPFYHYTLKSQSELGGCCDS